MDKDQKNTFTNFVLFMKHESSLMCSQESAILSQMNPDHVIRSCLSKIHPRLGLQNGILRSGFWKADGISKLQYLN
jgi:hypothetical protein